MTTYLSIFFTFTFFFSKFVLADCCSIPQNVLTAEEEWVQQAIQNTTGKIITVERTKDAINVLSTCSASLVGRNDIILTAAHCFKIKHKSSLIDTIVNRLQTDSIISKEFYFYIPVLNPHPLTSVSGQLSIFTAEALQLENFLATLPKISHYELDPKYSKHPAVDFSAYVTRNHSQRQYAEKQMSKQYETTIPYDFAFAKLSKPIPTTPLTVANYLGETKTFVAGYKGGALHHPLQVFSCISGATLLTALQFHTEHTVKALTRTIITDGAHTEALEQARQDYISTFNRLEGLSKEGVLHTCDDSFTTGVSGGPQLVVENQQVKIVGINSATTYSLLENNYTEGPKDIMGPRAANAFTSPAWIRILQK